MSTTRHPGGALASLAAPQMVDHLTYVTPGAEAVGRCRAPGS